MSQQSEFWHWKHLDCWQSWSNLFCSQNSNFVFYALLMMMKERLFFLVWAFGTIASLFCCHERKQCNQLCLDVMELRAVSHGGHCPTTRALPPSPGVKGMLDIVQAMTQLTFLAASCHCHLLCHYFSDISGIHTSFEINHEPYIYIIKTKFFGKSCRETYVISAGFDEYSVCVYLSSSIVSPGH